MKIVARFLAFLLAFLIVLNHSVYYYMMPTKKVIQIALLLLVITLWIVCYTMDVMVKKKMLVLMSVYYFIALFYYLYNIEAGFSYITRYCIYVPALIMIFCYLKKINRQKQLFYDISNIMLVIAVVSLFCWIVCSVFQCFEPLEIVETEWGMRIGDIPRGGYNYYYIYYELQIATGIWTRWVQYRNCGIFCEGPAYAVMLSIAVSVELFLRDKVDWKRIFILGITLVSTLTTTGVAFCIVCMAVKWFLSMKGSISKKFIYLPIIFSVLLILGGGLVATKSNQTSVRLRVNDYLNGFEAFQQAPVIGHGYNVDAEQKFEAGFTNSISDVLVRGGIVYGMIYFIPLLYMISRVFKYLVRGRRISKRDQELAGFGTSMFVLFLINILTLTFIMLSIIAFGVSEMINIVEREKIEDNERTRENGPVS